MPRRPSRSVPVLLLPGHGDDDAGHWLGLLEADLTGAGRQVSRVAAGDGLEAWVAAVRAQLTDHPDRGVDVVAHGLGAVVWLHHAAGSDGSGPRPDRVALVAPPSAGAPDGFLPPPLDLDAVRRAAEGTVLVGGDDDPQCPEGIAAAYGVPLKMATTVVPGGGHLDAAAGYGPWPAMSQWCARDNLAFY